MRTFILFIIIAGATVLYPHGQLQAQMQTKTFSYNKEAKSEQKKNPLYVPKNDKASKAPATAEDKTAQEIDRIFEKYKRISEQQDQAAANKPLKDKKVQVPDQTPAAAKDSSPSQQRSGFSGILEQYEQNKANKSKTNSIRFSAPDNLNK